MNDSQKKRIHDDLYLQDSEFKVKESFRFIGAHLHRIQGNLLDVGCSNGAFLDYLARSASYDFHLKGVDVHDGLLEQARERVPHSEFIRADVNGDDWSAVVSRSFDLVVMSGVHTIFDECGTWIMNLCSSCVDKGMIYIFGSMNPEPFDLVVKARRSSGDVWESGFNRISIKTLEAGFSAHGYSIRVIPFRIGIDLVRQDDPRRSYTVNYDGERQLRNGLELLCTQFLLIAQKRSTS